VVRFLDSFLNHRLRPYEAEIEGCAQGLSEVEEQGRQLSKRVLMVYLRLMSDDRRAVVATTAEGDRAYADLLFLKRVFDLPKVWE
jgi:hypothetical protein